MGRCTCFVDTSLLRCCSHASPLSLSAYTDIITHDTFASPQAVDTVARELMLHRNDYVSGMTFVSTEEEQRAGCQHYLLTSLNSHQRGIADIVAHHDHALSAHMYNPSAHDPPVQSCSGSCSVGPAWARRT